MFSARRGAAIDLVLARPLSQRTASQAEQKLIRSQQSMNQLLPRGRFVARAGCGGGRRSGGNVQKLLGRRGFLPGWWPVQLTQIQSRNARVIVRQLWVRQDL